MVTTVQPIFEIPKEFEYDVQDEPRDHVDKTLLRNFYKAAFIDKSTRLYDYMHKLTNSYVRQEANGKTGSLTLKGTYDASLIACFTNISMDESRPIDIRKDAMVHTGYLTHDNEYSIARNNHHITMFDYYKQILTGDDKTFPSELKLTALDQILHLGALSHKMVSATKAYLTDPSIKLYDEVAGNKKNNKDLRIAALNGIHSFVFFSEPTVSEHFWITDNSRAGRMIEIVQKYQKDRVLNETADELANRLVKWRNAGPFLTKNFIENTDLLSPTKSEKPNDTDKEKLKILRVWAANTDFTTDHQKMIKSVKKKYDELHTMTADISLKDKPWDQLSFYGKVYEAINVKNYKNT